MDTVLYSNEHHRASLLRISHIMLAYNVTVLSIWMYLWRPSIARQPIDQRLDRSQGWFHHHQLMKRYGDTTGWEPSSVALIIRSRTLKVAESMAFV